MERDVTMILHRAMSNEEADETLSRRSFRFLPGDRFKWFGTLEYVRDVVMNGRFNASLRESWKYRRLLRFEVISGARWFWRKRNEFRLDVRNLPKVMLGDVEDVTPDP